WIIEENGKIILEADALVIATGGLAAPKTGSDGSGLALLEELGYEIVPTFPALTPLL
ncbi:TPA: aminoacetone oxidase family FAD-binding enzyme, partial [bacterium]|nr:aminoacetone oxidase family FAD-binding enzyme [bacterium]